LPEVETPSIRPDVTTNWHLYVIRLSGLRLSRDEVVGELKKRNIGTSVHFLPVHLHPYYRETMGFKAGDYPVAEHAFEQILSLPLFPQMTDSDIDRVVAAVKEIVSENRA
jgi:dTDP-4-amino-4,6-dideoxygalactose transaminase